MVSNGKKAAKNTLCVLLLLINITNSFLNVFDKYIVSKIANTTLKGYKN